MRKVNHDDPGSSVYDKQTQQFQEDVQARRKAVKHAVKAIHRRSRSWLDKFRGRGV